MAVAAVAVAGAGKTHVLSRNTYLRDRSSLHKILEISGGAD